MLAVEFIRNFPIVSALVIYLITIIRVSSNRIRTWSESFFVFGFFFLGSYALSDFFYFRATDPEGSLLSAKVGLTFLTLSILYLFLFTKVFIGRMKPAYQLFSVPPAIFVFLIWFNMVVSVQQVSWGWEVTYNNTLFSAWLLYIIIYTIGGIFNLYKTYKIVREESDSLGRRVLGITLAFTSCLIGGLMTNALSEIAEVGAMPAFSVCLILPGLTTLMVVLPITWEKLVEAVKDWGSTRYNIKSAYLVFEDGTLINSKSVLPEEGVDSDLFSATLDVIQNFMRTSFPQLSGNWLKAIEHGDMRIVVERGKFTYLALVLTGEENDLLRRQMKDILFNFETKNRNRLMHWRGISMDAQGSDKVLETFFSDQAHFQL